MGKNVKVDFKGLEQLQKQFEKVNQSVQQDFVEQCAKELTARLLRKVIMRTPVGVYNGETYTCAKVGGLKHKGNRILGKNGGTLRRAWTKENGNPKVIRTGSWLCVKIVNSTEYASYVEYGHRTRGGKGWVPGHFMMTYSVQEIQSMAPAFLQKRLEEKLKEVFR